MLGQVSHPRMRSWRQTATWSSLTRQYSQTDDYQVLRETLCQKIKCRAAEEDTQHQPPASTYMWRHAHVHENMYMYVTYPHFMHIYTYICIIYNHRHSWKIVGRGDWGREIMALLQNTASLCIDSPMNAESCMVLNLTLLWWLWND